MNQDQRRCQRATVNRVHLSQAVVSKTKKRDADFVGSFEKGLRVLQAFEGARSSMTLSEVADRAGLDRAAARRFLLTLVELGFAERRDKHFNLTPRVLQLGFSYLSSLGLTDVMMPYLKEVSARLEESASVAVLDETEIVYVARVQTQRIMSVGLGIGARLPAATTSMGRVLLAHLDLADRRERLARIKLIAYTQRSVTSRAELEQALRRVREEGHALVDQELEKGLRSLAVPLRNRRGQVVAAMNVGTSASRVTKERLLRNHLTVLKEAAARAQPFLI